VIIFLDFSAKMSFSENDLIKKIEKYNWYHEIQLTSKLVTPGSIPAINELNRLIKEKIQKKIFFKNKRVLDIGCREGLYSFLAEKAGASEIIGIDNDLSAAAIDFLIPFFQSKVKMYELNLYEFNSEKFGAFDVVIMLGVLYHLKFPFWGLKRACDAVANKGIIVISTAILDLPIIEEMELLYFPSATGGPFGYDSPSYFNKKCLCSAMQANGFRFLESYKFNEDPVNIQLFFFEKDQNINSIKVKNKNLDDYFYGKHDMHSDFTAQDLSEIYQEQSKHIISEWNKIINWEKKLKNDQ